MCFSSLLIITSFYVATSHLSWDPRSLSTFREEGRRKKRLRFTLKSYEIHGTSTQCVRPTSMISTGAKSFFSAIGTRHTTGRRRRRRNVKPGKKKETRNCADDFLKCRASCGEFRRTDSDVNLGIDLEWYPKGKRFTVGPPGELQKRFCRVRSTGDMGTTDYLLFSLQFLICISRFASPFRLFHVHVNNIPKRYSN